MEATGKGRFVVYTVKVIDVPRDTLECNLARYCGLCLKQVELLHVSRVDKTYLLLHVYIYQ